jgi:hypothetical protein
LLAGEDLDTVSGHHVTVIHEPQKATSGVEDRKVIFTARESERTGQSQTMVLSE